MMLPVYIMSCDKYLKTLRPFLYLFEKHWGEWQPVTIVGFQPPTFSLPSQARFLSLGVDEGVQKWSDGLLRLIDIIPHDVFVLFFEDYFLTRPVDINTVYSLWDYMLGNERVLKTDLCAERAGNAKSVPFGALGDIGLVQSDPYSEYHMSLYLGMWRGSLLRKVLIPDETPWDVEIAGTNRLAEFGDSMLVIGSTVEPCKITLGHRYGDSSQLFLEGLSDEDKGSVEQLWRE